MKVLDFGCGCGRTLMPLLLRYPAAKFHGADVDADAIQWCSKNLSPAKFQATSPVPPLPFPSNHFDLVYAISVFTHLDEGMQDQWLLKLGRILKPDGILIFSVHGERAAQNLDFDGRKILMRSGFVHRRSAKLKGLVPDWYHTTWHTEKYILARLSSSFRGVLYHVVPGGTQDMVIAWRRSD